MRHEAGIVLLALVACLTGCDAGDVACIAGREGCPCAAGSTCESSPDAPLTCDHGWCVPRDCQRGGEGCGCYANGTCDPLDGVPMTCADGLCRATVTPDPGTLNGACEAGVCGDHEGAALECVRGRCELAECPSGALGCPCGSYGRCDPYGGREPRCSEGVCAIAGCAAGQDGCACRADGSCDAGACRRGLCLAEPGLPVTVTGDVRACELVLDVASAQRANVTFAEGILGHSRRSGARLAIAFTQRRDRAFDAAPLRVDASAEAELVSATCFDRLGHRADGARVQLGEGP